jgi:single-stranded-DNA-specific exonuclease
VDCGITGMEEIEYAYSLGMEVIVTDHHEPLDEIPKAVAVIDCKRKDSVYPFKGLAGVGVVFKLTQAISQRLGLEEKEYLKYLDIVCIGTISDIVPLIDENRVISKLGLRLVAQTRCLGLKSLLEANVGKNSVINANTVSFGIAPRINACGRIGYELDAVKLFMTENLYEARETTEKLNSYNKIRQDIEKKIFEEAKEIIEKNNMQNNNTIIIGKEGWHHGVIGIVASKITEEYFKPTILIGFENGIGKGSGRSVPGFDLHDALHSLGKYLDKYGGHEMAVGVTVSQKNFDIFAEELEKKAREAKTEQIVPIISIDKEITAKELTIETAEKLIELEPYGTSNKVPMFLIRNLKIDSIRTLVDGKHLKLTLQDGSNIIYAIGFNLGKYADEFLLGDKVDIIGMIEINEFNNIKNIQINMKDMRRSY